MKNRDKYFLRTLKKRIRPSDTLIHMGNDSKHTAIYTAFDDYDQPEIIVPERNLLRAILLNALADLRRPGEFNRKATDYFINPDEEYIFSFRSICSFLQISPQHILILAGLERGKAQASDGNLSSFDQILEK